jgi:hypothetical protein
LSSMAAQIQISEEDQLRAGWYALLAQLLSREPGNDLLQMLRGLEGDESDLGKGIRALAAAARGTTVASAEREFFDLFIGVGQGVKSVLGRLHRHRRSSERRLDRPGARLGQPVQPRRPLRQGRLGARARAWRAPPEVSDEEGRRRVEADSAGRGDQRDRRQDAGDPRAPPARQRLLAGLGQAQQRAGLPVPQVRAFWGTNNVDHQARICHSTTVAGVANTWGYGAMTNSYNDIHNSQARSSSSAAIRRRPIRSRCCTC